MNPRVFIVDDEAPARNRLKTLLADIRTECPNDVAGEAENAQEALDRIAACKPDIVLLDVQMPGMNGLELARQFAKVKDGPAVLFVTAYDEYALKAFEVHALDYLLKPVRASRLREAIQRACGLRAPALGGGSDEAGAEPARNRQSFSVQERGRLLLVPAAEVIYLKAELKYVTLRTLTDEYLIEESLTSIEEEFASVFVRVHRNALVARAAIVGVERGGQLVDGAGEADRGQDAWQVVLRGLDERLPISRRQWPVVKALVR